MFKALKALCLAAVVGGVAAVYIVRDVAEPEVAAVLAVRQFDGSDESIRELRAYDRAKHVLDWLWVLIPVTALALYGGDFAGRRGARSQEQNDETVQ